MERLYFSEDRRRIVKENDAAAAFLAVPKGAEIPAAILALMTPPDAPKAPEDASPLIVVNKESALPRIRRR